MTDAEKSTGNGEGNWRSMVHAVRNVTVCYVRRNCVHHKNQNLHCKMYVYVIYLVGIVSYILSLSFQVFSFRISIFLSIFLCTDMQRSLSLSTREWRTLSFFLCWCIHSQFSQLAVGWYLPLSANSSHHLSLLYQKDFCFKRSNSSRSGS